MSTKIIEIANVELERLKSGKGQYFDLKIRRDIYNILNADAISTPTHQRQSLAIQTVEFIMPLFVPVDAHDALVFQLLEGAKEFSNNRISDFEKLDEIVDVGYHTAQWFGYNFATKQRNFQSAYAGAAAYRALIEVMNIRNPFDGLSNDLTDEGFMSSPRGDTAVQASFAYSTSPTLNECQPKLVYEFWEWWVKVTVHNALQYKRA